MRSQAYPSSSPRRCAGAVTSGSDAGTVASRSSDGAVPMPRQIHIRRQCVNRAPSGLHCAASGAFDRQRTTFSARRYRHVALRALCAAPRGAVRAPCGVPDVFLCAPCVVPDAAPYQTSASQWTALRAWCLSGRQQVTPSELQARPQVQTQPRIQKKQERFDDRPASVPNVHPCQALRFAALLHVAQTPVSTY
jgi:hypothetical protein